jgi:hypothetical protein
VLPKRFNRFSDGRISGPNDGVDNNSFAGDYIVDITSHMG